MRRRLFIASSLAAAASSLEGCGLGNALTENQGVHKVLDSADKLNHLAIGTRGMAREYPDSAIDRNFRVNGLDTPSDATYTRLRHDNFRSYKLVVDGLVERPQAFTLAELRAMPLVAQTTRHDCVEGWSAIGKWRGVRTSTILGMVQPKPNARYLVFTCFDKDEQGTPFYGSLDVHQAAHPQTLLALDLNDAPLDADHGAPVRLRIPTQLGYKSTKWVKGIHLVDSFKSIAQGNGGYWEDQGYDWYAGI